MKDGGTAHTTLTQSVDAPIVLIGFLQAFNLCSYAAIEERVIEVGGLVEITVLTRHHLVVYPVERIRRVVVKDGPAFSTQDELLPVLVGQLVGLVDIK